LTDPNPYAPPRSTVADVDAMGARYQPVRVWSARGRIGRLRLLAYTGIGYWAYAAVSVCLGIALAAASIPLSSARYVGYVFAAPYLVLSALLCIQRAHDLGYSGWLILALIVPVIGLAVGLILLFKAGKTGANEYGAPPPPNGAALTVVAVLWPTVIVVGIVLAVAIPAFQHKAQRAQAAGTK
jgi:uncharacterized membrane protein YhaH (DUF805 family)